MAEVTVVVPVGPNLSNKQWLDECLKSLHLQTEKVDEILLIDDQANLDWRGSSRIFDSDSSSILHINDKTYYETNLWKTPWLSGIPHAFNYGVALARNELVVMLGSDDWLEPEAIEKLLEVYEKNKRKDAYYSFTIKYSDNDELQDLPNNCAAVTKGLWRLTGGFPPESEIGACDSIFISMMLRNHPKRLIKVAQGYPLYNYRRHNDSDSGTRPVEYQGPIATVRDVYTRNWKKPTWT